MSIMWIKDIQFVVMMTNSGVNPFVYAWRLENCRKAFKSDLPSIPETSVLDTGVDFDY